MIEIKKVVTNRQWQEFLHLPWRIYQNDPYWVPPSLEETDFLLNPKKNPFYKHAKRELFLAYKNGQVVGRIVSIIDENYNSYHQAKIGWFGFFETIPDLSVVKALLNTAKTWIKTQGMAQIYGPVNPSTNETCGILIDDFKDPPCVMMTYNPPYYPELLEQAGLKKIKDLLAYEISLPFRDGIMARLGKMAIRLQNRYPDVKIRPINIKDWDEELKRVQEVYNHAWSRNWGFVPMTDAEIHKMAERLKPLVIPELVWLAEVKTEPVGFLMFLPDYFQVLKHLNGSLSSLGWLKFLWYRRKITRIRAVTLGIKRQYQHTGIVPLFLFEAGKALRKFSYQRLEFSWLLEDNIPVIRMTEMIHAHLTKRYRIYGTKV